MRDVDRKNLVMTRGEQIKQYFATSGGVHSYIQLHNFLSYYLPLKENVLSSTTGQYHFNDFYLVFTDRRILIFNAEDNWVRNFGADKINESSFDDLEYFCKNVESNAIILSINEVESTKITSNTISIHTLADKLTYQIRPTETNSLNRQKDILNTHDVWRDKIVESD